jgi:ADP-ribose pyrophosphatase YjhB (NUDIX family)
MSKDRHKMIPGVYVIPIKDNKVLLLRRFNTGFGDGKYSLIGGHVEQNETFMQAIIKEAKEEAGIEISPKELKFMQVMHRKEDGERMDLFFSIDNWQGEIRNMEPSKCDDLRWFEIDKLPVNIIPWIKQAIENLDKNHYSEYGWQNQRP